jgi:hypothetical protein
MADKIELIGLIQALANKHGSAPSMRNFALETGLSENVWKGKYWARWNDAIAEAGLSPNEWGTDPLDKESVLKSYISLISELGRIPTDADQRLKRQSDNSFPSLKGLKSAIGTGLKRISGSLEYALRTGASENILVILRLEVARLSTFRQNEIDDEALRPVGYVYLLKAGKDYKIGKTNDLFRRHGELKVQLPEKGEPIHHFETDDPSGIEAYWHNRFKHKRKNGEWFALDASDIKAFKRRRTFM